MKVFVGSKDILEHTPKLIDLDNVKYILHVNKKKSKLLVLKLEKILKNKINVYSKIYFFLKS